ncbi:MAG: metallophosphoesterase family protein [Desulfobacterales bacterium]|nr:metallophosphoesterase family protein [Desulfobacterales bacterium]
MVIAGLTDIHGSRAAVEKARSILDTVDVILLVGDITNFGRAADVGRVVDALSHNSAKLLAVSGNCDYPEVDAYLSASGINIHAGCAVIDNVVFLGLGGSLITPFGTPNEYTEEEIKSALQQGIEQAPPDLPLVLVAHQPPYQTQCDRLSSGSYVGSVAVREFIEKYQPLVCFTGHIHEARAIDQIGRTPIINPGRLGQGYLSFARVADTLQDYGIKPID